VVAVTTGLLELLEPQEIEGVLAHELSHVLNRDILISSVAATLAGVLSLMARMVGYSAMFGGRGGSHGSAGRGAVGPLSDDRDGPSPAGALLLMLLAPIIGLIVQLAISRSREYGADATGARLAGTPRGLASALGKLDHANRRIPMRTADPATAHLYIMEPSAAGKLRRLFSTHPPIEERIERLLASA
jgi:heat shock protein HtpX